MTEDVISRIVDGLASGELTIGEFFAAVERVTEAGLGSPS